MRRNIFLIVTFLCLSFVGWSQQDAMFTQYFFNPLHITPAYAGSRELLSLNANIRSQWAGMQGAPETQSITAHAPLRKLNVGLGLQLFNDIAGPLQTTVIAGSYSYWVPIGQTSKLRFGLQTSIKQLKISREEIVIQEKDDPSFTGPSDFKIHPDINFGTYLYDNKYYVGTTITHLVQKQFNFDDFQRANPAQYFRHYYVFGGMVFKVNSTILFRPSTLIKFQPNAPADIELNGNFIFQDRVWLGAGLRTSNKAGLSSRDNQLVGYMQFNINNQLRVGYSYDADLNGLRKFNSGSHEIMIGYDLSIFRDKMVTPRYF